MVIKIHLIMSEKEKKWQEVYELFDAETMLKEIPK